MAQSPPSPFRHPRCGFFSGVVIQSPGSRWSPGVNIFMPLRGGEITTTNADPTIPPRDLIIHPGAPFRIEHYIWRTGPQYIATLQSHPAT